VVTVETGKEGFCLTI